MVDWGREEVMQHALRGTNVALLTPRMTADAYSPFVSSNLISNKTGSRYDQTYFFPLYLYPEPGTLDIARRVNFEPKLYAAIRKAAGLDNPRPDGEREGPVRSTGGSGGASDASSTGLPPLPAQAGPESPSPRVGRVEVPDELRVFDYIYGVLHSPDYRRTYAQFLKIDFPRIPFPASAQVFAHVADKGGQLRRLHLMEEEAVGATPFAFLGDGTGEVGKVVFVEGSPSPRSADAESPSPLKGEGRVYINADQFFDAVPRVAWEFHIGGYQPAQKWLKDRKGRTLSFDDVRHYQKIIKILRETDRIMREIMLSL